VAKGEKRNTITNIEETLGKKKVSGGGKGLESQGFVVRGKKKNGRSLKQRGKKKKRTLLVQSGKRGKTPPPPKKEKSAMRK